MDLIFMIDEAGNGKVVFCGWGHSYEADVKNWEALVSYQPQDEAVTLLAQRHVNKYRASLEEEFDEHGDED